jgi:hypothetical protein
VVAGVAREAGIAAVAEVAGAAGAEVALVPAAAEDFGGIGTPGLTTLMYDSEVGLMGAWICPSAIWEIMKAWNLPFAAFGAASSVGF